MNEANIERLDVDVIGSQIERIGERRIELDCFLRGEKYPPTSLVLEIRTPRSSDSSAKWSFSGRKRLRVLIVCAGNSCRSQMAEGYLTERASELIEAHSVGLCPEKQVNQHAIAAMQEFGIDISHHRPKSIQSYDGENFDYVISVCDVRAEKTPFRSPTTVMADFGVVDPVAYQGLLPYDQLRDEFNRTRDTIFEILDRFIEQISSKTMFLEAKPDRQKTMQEVFEPVREKQMVLLNQLEKVVINPMHKVEVFEVCPSDMELALVKNIVETKKHFPRQVSFGVALGITLMTSSVSMIVPWGETTRDLSSLLDTSLWILAVALVALGVKSWWSERYMMSKDATIKAIMKCFKVGPREQNQGVKFEALPWGQTKSDKKRSPTKSLVTDDDRDSQRAV